MPYEESFWTTRQVSPAGLEGAGLLLLPECEQLPQRGPGTLVGSAITLACTCIGGGLLTLPFVFAKVGPVLGSLLLLLCALWSGFMSHLLCQSCDWAQKYSFEELAIAAFGHRTGAVTVELLVVWLLIGAISSLLVITGDSVEFAWAAALPLLEDELWQRRTLFTILDVILVIFPLSWVQSPASLIYSNSIAMSCTLLVATMLMVRGAGSVAKGSVGALLADVPAVSLGPAALAVLPIVMLCMACQVQVPNVYGELDRRSLHCMNQALVGTGSICFVLYSAVAAFGVMAVRSNAAAIVPGNVLDGFLPGDHVALAMRMVMAGTATLVCPMLVLPCRSTIDHLAILGGCVDKPVGVPWKMRHLAETVLILGVALAIASWEGDLARVFGLTGATAGTLICYVLPPAFFASLRRSQPAAVAAATRGKAAACVALLSCTLPMAVVVTWHVWRGAD